MADFTHFSLSSRPDEHRPSIAPYLAPKPTRSLTESEYVREAAAVNQKIRGVKLAILQTELEIQRETHKQKTIQLGTAKLKTDETKLDFQAQANKLVAKRAQVQGLIDTATVAVQEWKIGQSTAKSKIQGLQLSLDESEQRNTDKKTTLGLSSKALFN